MLGLIDGSTLETGVKESALRTLRAIGKAEAVGHGHSHGPIHLHELGGQDTLADIVGVMASIAHIRPGRITCGPVNLGRGFVDTSHGRMPVPAPATGLLIRDMLVFSEGPEQELTTPTGAAILGVLAEEYGAIPSMRVRATGTGAGTRDNEGFPNLLRVFQGEAAGKPGGESAVMIECGLDDVSPEYLAPAMDTLLEAGALEVHMIPVLAKKGRHGILLRVLTQESKRDDLVRHILESTGSPGVRFWGLKRDVLARESVIVTTPHGPLSVKRWWTPSGRRKFKPEYEEVRSLAQKAGIPETEMRDLAVARYLLEYGDEQEKD
jgi:uncharacterized protein (TIGR00299 family) protein